MLNRLGSTPSLENLLSVRALTYDDKVAYVADVLHFGTELRIVDTMAWLGQASLSQVIVAVEIYDNLKTISLHAQTVHRTSLCSWWRHCPKDVEPFGVIQTDAKVLNIGQYNLE